ncbi:Uncharacterized protein FKW44_025029, partial [Caligus rogercresseyi]
MNHPKREIYYSKLEELLQKKANNTSILDKETYGKILAFLKKYEVDNQSTLTQIEHAWKNRYQLILQNGVHKIARRGHTTLVVPKENLFEVINETHMKLGHAGRNIMIQELQKNYCNVTRENIMLFLELCESCQLKQKKVKKGIVVNPIVSQQMNSRCQVDLIDMQSQADREYRYIMVYQDHLTKFVCLRPLKTKTAEEVANHLLHIFSDKGAPQILQSDNGREFANKIVLELVHMWPECKLVHGKPRHSQSQGSVERANRDIQDILMMWQRDNKTTKWSDGLWFVQFAKNRRFHSGIGRTPYEAMYGHPATVGLEGLHLLDSNINTEEQLSNMFEQINSNETNENQCVSCQELVPTSQKCFICELPCHSEQPCSTIMVEAHGHEQIKCTHCQNDEDRQGERHGASKHQQNQAKRMMDLSSKRFHSVDVGQCVQVPVPGIDRGKTDPRNVLAVVLDVTEAGLYRLGTTNGILKQLYSRNQFNPTKNSFINIEDVPKSKEVTLRQTASVLSEGNGQ